MEKVQCSGTRNEQYVIVSEWGIILCILSPTTGYLWSVCRYERGVHVWVQYIGGGVRG